MFWGKILYLIILFSVISASAVFAEKNIETDKKPTRTSSIAISVEGNIDVGLFSKSKLVFPSGNQNIENGMSSYRINESIPNMDQPGFLIFEINVRPDDFAEFVLKKMDMISEAISTNRGKIKGIIFDMSPDNIDLGWRENDFVKLYCMFARDLKNKYPEIPVGGAGFSYVFENEADGNFKEVSKQLDYFLEFSQRTGVPCEILYIKSSSLVAYGYYARNSFLTTKVFPKLNKKPMLYDSVAFGRTSGEQFFDALFTQCFICSFKGEADLIEMPHINGIPFLLEELSKTEQEIHINGLDRMAFLGLACKSKNGNVVVVLATPSSPDYLFSSLGEAYKVEFNNYVHAFSDGFMPPTYNRVRANFSNMPWIDKKMKLEDYVLTEHGFERKEERFFDGRKDFYINRAFLPPTVIIMKFEEVGD